MAANTQINPGAAGDLIRTVDRTTSKTQIVGLDLNPGGPTERLAGLSSEMIVLDTAMPLILLELQRISTLLSILVGTTVADTEIFIESGI